MKGLSLLNRLYRISRNEKTNRIEDYCTEVLCYCLNTDKTFRQSFLEIIDKEIDAKENFVANTQVYSDDLSTRPDIVMESSEVIIIIENKIEAQEGKGQCDAYAADLKNRFKEKKKVLVYLTKYGRDSSFKNKYAEIIYKHILWSEISNLIYDDNDHFSIELRRYIQDTIMKKVGEVSNNDIAALSSIIDVLAGYDGFFNDYKEKLKKVYHLNFTSSRLTKVWIDQKFANNLVAEFKIEDTECAFWFGLYMKNRVVEISVELEIFDSATEKAIALKKLVREIDGLQDPYSDIVDGENYEAFYFAKALNHFANQSVSVLESWLDECFKLFFEKINTVEPRFNPSPI